MVALTLADAMLDKFGGDTVTELAGAFERYTAAIRARLTPESR
jgi:hypothetical protein